MDLGAYLQIEYLSKIAKENGIDIPRLRGYRLMKYEEPVTKEEIDLMCKESEIQICKNLCESTPFWSTNSESWICNVWTDYLKSYYLVKNEKKEYIGIRWDRIHGWKRKILKFAIKKKKKAIKKQYDMFNKYVGRNDVLYIHSRTGGNNWKNYDKKTELMNQPWFLDRVDDSYDSTYCDFYAKIKEV